MNHSTQKTRASAIAAVIIALAVLALVAAVGVGLHQSHGRLQARMVVLESAVAKARDSVTAMEKQVGDERAMREEAESSAKLAADEADQARKELRTRQAALDKGIQELEASVLGFQEQVTAAVEAKTKMESELSRETERRKAMEQEVAAIRSQLEQQEQQHQAESSMQRQPQRTQESHAASQPGASPAAAPATVSSPPPADAGREERQAQDRVVAAAAGAADARAASAADSAVVMNAEAPHAAENTAAKYQFADESPAESVAAFDTPPRPVDLVSPEYPRSLKQDGMGGRVMVAFTVNKRGRVKDAEVVDASDPEFGVAALRAVRKWRFKPALLDGEPVEVRISQPVTFNSQ